MRKEAGGSKEGGEPTAQKQSNILLPSAHMVTISRTVSLWTVHVLVKPQFLFTAQNIRVLTNCVSVVLGMDREHPWPYHMIRLQGI